MAEKGPADDDCVACFRVTGQTCYDDEQRDFTNVDGQVFDCVFHPTLPILACGLSGGSIRLFRGVDPTSPFISWIPDDRFRVDTESHINRLAWNADGTRLAAGCFDGTVALWYCDDDENSPIPYQAKEHPLAVFAIVWNRWNRNLFATRSRDEGTLQKVLTWNSDVEIAVKCQSFELDSKFIWDFDWISSTRLAVCTHEGTILICDMGNIIPVKCLNHPGVWRVRWHFTLHYLISCSTDGSVKVWSKKRYKDVGNTQLEGRIHCVDCHGIRSGGAAIIASGLEDGTVVIWHVTDNRWQTLDGHSDAVTKVSFSPDGLYLASLDNEELLIIWSTKNWIRVFEYEKALNVDWNHIRWNYTGKKLTISNSTHEVYVIELKNNSPESSEC